MKLLKSHDAGRLRALFSALALLTFLISCSEQTGTGLPDGGPGGLRFAPRFTYFGPVFSAAPVVNIRLTARNASTGVRVAQTTVSVDPDAAEWDLGLEVAADVGEVIVMIELLNAEGGIEWSGETAPIRVEAGRNNAPPTPVQLFQGPPANLQVTGVTVTPATASVEEGGTVQLNASVQPGNITPTIFWSSLDPAIAQVTNTGLVTTLRNGSARIIAHSGAHADTAAVTATQRAASIVVTPDTTRISSLGVEFALSARVLDGRGGEITGAPVEWSSSTPGVAVHIGTNRFRAVGNGTAILIARSGTLTASGVAIVSQRATRVVVTPASASIGSVGGTQTFTAAVTDQGGNPVVTTLVWRSSNPAVASIDANGVARALAAGTTEISAVANAGTANEVSGTATLTVTQTIVEVRLEPTSLAFTAPGQSAQIAATAYDGNGAVVSGAVFEWTSSNNAVATVTNGLVTAVGAGTAEIRARAGNVTASAAVTVAPQVQQLPNLIVSDVNIDSGMIDELDPTIVHITIANTGAAASAVGTLRMRILDAGTGAQLHLHEELHTGLAVGATSNMGITFTVDSLQIWPDSFVVEVTADALNTNAESNEQDNTTTTDPYYVRFYVRSVRIEPETAIITQLGDSIRINATAYDRRGQVRAATLGFQVLVDSMRTSEAPNIIIRNGWLIGFGVTGALVEARHATTGFADTAYIQVRPIPDFVSIDVGAFELTVGDSTRVSAQAYDAGEDRLPYAPEIISLDTAVVRIGAGMAHAVAPGSARIVASVRGHWGVVADTVTLTVSGAQQANLRISRVVFEPSGDISEALTGSYVVTLVNNGLGAAPPTALRLRVRVPDIGTALLDYNTNHAGIAAGDSLTVALQLFGDTAYPWSEYVFAEIFADAPALIAESDEEDNYFLMPTQRIAFTTRRVTLTPTDTTLTALGDSVLLIATAFDRHNRERPDAITYQILVDSAFNQMQNVILRNGWAVAMGATPAVVIRALSASGHADTATVRVQPAQQPIANLRAVRIAPYPGGQPTESRATYAVTVRNTGNAAAGANTVRITMLNPSTGASLHVREFGMNTLAAGDSIVIVAQLDYQADQTWPDSIRAQLTVDALAVIAESDETDNVVSGDLQRVSFTPTSLVLAPLDTTLTAVGDSVRLVARSLDRFGREVPDSFTYRIVVDSSFGESPAVDLRANGWVVARRNTPAVVIEARSRTPGLIGVIDSATVRVQQRAASIQISAARDTIYPSDNGLQLTATALDANQNEFTPVVAWSSLDPDILGVGESGFVTALQTSGSGRIVATTGGRTSPVADTFTVYIANDQEQIVRFEIPPQIGLIVADTFRTPVFAYNEQGGLVAVTPAWVSTDPAVATVDANGLVEAVATVSDTAYVIATYQQFTDTMQVIVVVPEEGTRYWLGRTSNWSDAQNWSGNAVPHEAETAYFRATIAQGPILTENVVVGGVVTEPGVVIDNNDFDLTIYETAYVQGDGGIVGFGQTVIAGEDVPMLGSFSNVRIDGGATALGPVTVNGTLVITSGLFNVPATTSLRVTGDVMQQNGSLHMVDGSMVTVEGDYVAAGGDTRGHLLGGRLELAGDLTVQQNSNYAFSPESAHATVFNGTQTQTVSMAIPDSTMQRLGTVTIPSPHLVRFATEAHIIGPFVLGGALQVPSVLEFWNSATFSQTAIVVFEGEGGMVAFRSLFADPNQNVDPQHIAFREDRVVSMILPETMTMFAGDRQTIAVEAYDGQQNPVQITPQWVSRDASVATVDADGLVTGMQVDGTTWVVATYGNLVDSTQVTVDLPEANTRVWLGHSQDWHDANNWSPRGVPTGDHLVRIRATPLAPLLSERGDANGLLVDQGAVLDVGAFLLVVSGNATVYGSITGTGQVMLTGAQQAIQGTFTNVLIGGAVSNVGSVTVNGDMRIESGSYTPSSDWATIINGGLYRTGGELIMVGNRPYVQVRGEFVSEGGDSRGRLSAGILEVHGNFTVRGAAGAAFAPTFSHVTYFSGTQPQTVSFTQQGTDVQYLNIIAVFNTTGVTFTHMGSPNLRIASVAEALNGGRMIVPQGMTLDAYSAFYVRTGSTMTNNGTVVVPNRAQWQEGVTGTWQGNLPVFRDETQ